MHKFCTSTWLPMCLLTSVHSLTQDPEQVRVPADAASKNIKPHGNNFTHFLKEFWEWELCQTMLTRTSSVYSLTSPSGNTMRTECKHGEKQGRLSQRSADYNSATHRNSSVLLALPTCLKSRVIVTQWYSLPFWILGLCHQLLVPSIAFDIGWCSVKRK